MVGKIMPWVIVWQRLESEIRIVAVAKTTKEANDLLLKLPPGEYEIDEGGNVEDEHLYSQVSVR